MLTGELKNKVDRLWDAFWTGGISNPLTVIEQITYLLFIKRLDEIQTQKELVANRLKREIESPIYTDKNQDLRWSKFKNSNPEQIYQTIQLKVFPFIKTLNGNSNSAYARFMKDATFMISTPGLLDKVISMIDEIPMHDRDTKGDLYEYLLSKLTTAGRNGQFRTPRHIIKMMVELIQPKPEDKICDPACGTAGFLVSSADYIRENYSDKFHDKNFLEHYNSGMFNGSDFDTTMLRISTMNLILHGIENPNVDSRDSLSELTSSLEDMYDVVLANPPFKGSLDFDSVSKDLLQIVKTKKTELLFIALFIRLLKTGGRCACIVPDGVLFGSSKAHSAIRQELIDRHQLQAVISMPSGVFKPYAGVSTAILVFTKTGAGGTDNVWFYDMQADGYSLDDKRTPLDVNKHENNNIPDIVTRFHNKADETKRKRTEQSFMVPADEIRKNKYDLSINRYKEIVYEEVQYAPPKEILADINRLEDEIRVGLKELEGLLK